MVGISEEYSTTQHGFSLSLELVNLEFPGRNFGNSDWGSYSQQSDQVEYFLRISNQLKNSEEHRKNRLSHLKHFEISPFFKYANSPSVPTTCARELAFHKKIKGFSLASDHVTKRNANAH